MQQLELDVKGMSCGHCVRAVEKALQEVDGVRVKSVVIGAASVEIDPSRASVGDVIDAVSDAGYEAEEKA